MSVEPQGAQKRSRNSTMELEVPTRESSAPSDGEEEEEDDDVYTELDEEEDKEEDESGDIGLQKTGFFQITVVGPVLSIHLFRKKESVSTYIDFRIIRGFKNMYKLYVKFLKVRV